MRPLQPKVQLMFSRWNESNQCVSKAFYFSFFFFFVGCQSQSHRGQRLSDLILLRLNRCDNKRSERERPSRKQFLDKRQLISGEQPNDLQTAKDSLELTLQTLRDLLPRHCTNPQSTRESQRHLLSHFIQSTSCKNIAQRSKRKVQ